MKRLLLLCLMLPCLYGMETGDTGYIGDLEKTVVLKERYLILLHDINELEDLLLTLEDNISLAQELKLLTGESERFAVERYKQEKQITEKKLALKKRELANIVKYIAQIRRQAETYFE